jgi:type I restriction enzyme S subunit
MKKYDSYNNSGIDWIGELPDDWNVKKIKHRCYVKARVGWKGLKSDEFLTDGYSYLVTGSDFKNDSVNWNECYHIDEARYEEDPYIQLQEDDLLITKDGTIGKLAIVKELDKPACLNSGIFVVRSTNEDFKTEFLFWVLKSKSFKQFNDYTSYGSTIQHLYQNVFVEFAFPFPKTEEQTAIASYLDRKTAEIDELIADKKRLLELYEEEKTAIINQAVTKGINPDAPMKDSGIEWLGAIPEHWEMKRFKYYFNIITEKVEEDLPKIGLENIESKSGRFIETDTEFAGQGVRFRPKDILFGKLRPYLAKVWLSNFDGQAVGDFYVFRSKQDVIPEFAKYRILDSSFIEVTNSSTYGSKMPRVSWEFISDLPIAFPKIHEQESIVQHIEAECTLIDSKKAKTEKLIELLTEYRTALISEVVTGKVKVI